MWWPARSSSRSPSGTSSASSTATGSERSRGTTTSIWRRTSALPRGGFVTHTLNLRLHPDDLTYIATHAGDRVLIADKVLWPLVEQFKDRVGFEHIVAIGPGPTPDGAIDYEELLATPSADDFAYRDIDERAAAAMCYTSGTTGKPKGVVYSHRAIAVHALTAGSLLGMTCDDVCLPVVPMFHANA